jgi:hypothetical protein
MAEKAIAPFSDPAAIMLSELLTKLTKHDNKHEKKASMCTADL